MNDHNLERRVGNLETRMAEVATALTGLKSILDEVKAGITNARPSAWVLIPSVLAFVAMLVAGVVSVTSIKGDISSLYAVKGANEAQLVRMQNEIDLLERRDWDELERERDHYRKIAGGTNGDRT